MKISVFTLNIWGLKFFGTNRTERVKALAKCLINNGYDIVCLQELWCQEDFNYLRQSCEQIFKYIHYFYSGMLGSGMCIMSRYPIIDIHYHPFRLNGYLHMLYHGDWFGGKGIGLCRINVDGFIVDVYTTHLHACYDTSEDKYVKHRIVQAFESANFIRITSTGSDLAVLAGDFNSEPDDICYKLISLGANMKDCYSSCLTNDIEYTYNHPNNSYRNLKENKTRLDYIMYKFNKNNLVIVKEHKHSLPFLVPGETYSYSDHEPIEAVFEISADKFYSDRKIDANNDSQYKTDLQTILNVSLDICNKKRENLIPLRLVFLFFLMIIICYQISMYLGINEYYMCAIVLIIFIIIIVYNSITISTEENCVRGFYHEIETLFFDDKSILISP
ncbi:Hypothetical protein CINCED_3A018926 [Cinara cedri]|uniref:sphingomyelin phosphodiesterase n=1 Tax=Cinara cedri TaxID=506608 RepID=A0A5E4M0U6_9HEMI|nr:Hypothetical protein CINCED_3A018926 [Cinara cedri]